jgi:hypothetical protein
VNLKVKMSGRPLSGVWERLFDLERKRKAQV